MLVQRSSVLEGAPARIAIPFACVAVVGYGHGEDKVALIIDTDEQREMPGKIGEVCNNSSLRA